MVLQILYQGCYGRGLLTDGDIDTIDRLSLLIEAFLVDDGINSDGGLAGLPVTDDQLTLAASDRNHRINSLQTCLKRFLHRLTVDDTWGLSVQRHLESISQIKISLSIDCHSQRIDYTSQEAVIDPNGSNTMCTPDALSLLDACCRPEENTTDIVFLQVHDNRHSAILKFKQLISFSIAKAIDASHAIADSQYSADFIKLLLRVDAL